MTAAAARLQLEFCGELVDIPAVGPFTIGRAGDFVIDESPYLHRHFLELVHQSPMWWIRNVGTQLAATLSDPRTGLQAWLTPQATMPLVFQHTIVRFTAGPTAYEFELLLESSPYVPPATAQPDDGDVTVGRVPFNREQRQLIVALAEPVLRRGGSGMSHIPTSSEAAQRLGWPLTKFNRKLDYVCSKLERGGVQGLHGGPGDLALNRRARLVEYAVATSLVTAIDLALLDGSD